MASAGVLYVGDKVGLGWLLKCSRVVPMGSAMMAGWSHLGPAAPQGMERPRQGCVTCSAAQLKRRLSCSRHSGESSPVTRA